MRGLAIASQTLKIGGDEAHGYPGQLPAALGVPPARGGPSAALLESQHDRKPPDLEYDFRISPIQFSIENPK